MFSICARITDTEEEQEEVKKGFRVSTPCMDTTVLTNWGITDRPETLWCWDNSYGTMRCSVWRLRPGFGWPPHTGSNCTDKVLYNGKLGPGARHVRHGRR